MYFTREHWRTQNVVWVRWFSAIIVGVIVEPYYAESLGISNFFFFAFLSFFLCLVCVCVCSCATLALSPLHFSLCVLFSLVMLCVQLMFHSMFFCVCQTFLGLLLHRLDKKIFVHNFRQQQIYTPRDTPNRAHLPWDRVHSSAIHFISPHVYFMERTLCIV